MEPKMYSMRFTTILIVYLSISITTFSILCDARSFAQMLKSQDTEQPKSNSIHELVEKLKAINHLDLHFPSSSFELEPVEVSSPFSSPPLASFSQAPLPVPGNVPLPPPYCVNQNPPFSPHPPQTSTPSPTSPVSPSGPTYSPTLNPPANRPSPHPPCIILSPPKTPPSPPKSVPNPSPPIILPPIVYSPPSAPNPQFAVWCVAKPAVPDPIVQEAMDYACGSGADCKSIQRNGSCFQPDTLLSHASYAFNNYWQNTKVAGGTCDFGGTAMLVTVDPSFDGCHFFYN